MLTPFGKALRLLRVEKGMRLLDLANKIERSAAFISAVETGRKAIPDGFVVTLSRAMELDASEIKKLRRGADQTRKEVRVDQLPAEDRELVAAFARRLDDAPDHLKSRLKRWVLKSNEGEIPFRRKRRGMIVRPASTAKIREFAEKVRSAFVQDDECSFPIMDVLEFRMHELIKDFYLDIRSVHEMGSLEGMVVSGECRMTLREDVYEEAWSDNGRARFTAAHELGHFLMHRKVALARTCDTNTKPYEDSEWQADTFAASLLISVRHMPLFKNANDLASKCVVSGAAANVMWSKLSSEGLIDQKPSDRQ